MRYKRMLLAYTRNRRPHSVNSLDNDHVSLVFLYYRLALVELEC